MGLAADFVQLCFSRIGIKTRKLIQSCTVFDYFSLQKMTLPRNECTLAVVAREIQEEHPRNSQSRNTAVPRFNGDYITQVSEGKEGSMPKKLSQDFIRTKSQIVGTLSKLYAFLLIPQIRTLSGTVPRRSQISNTENQEPKEASSQNDPRPEEGTSRYRLAAIYDLSLRPR